MRNPRTNQEWHEAVDAAKGALVLESARMYGLVRGGPKVNIARCEEILLLGKKKGFQPSQDAVMRFMAAIMKG